MDQGPAASEQSSLRMVPKIIVRAFAIYYPLGWLSTQLQAGQKLAGLAGKMYEPLLVVITTSKPMGKKPTQSECSVRVKHGSVLFLPFTESTEFSVYSQLK